MALRVEHEPLLVHPAIEVDGELGDAEERVVVLHEPDGQPFGAAHGHSAGDAEVPVEPRVEERTAVDLDADLAPSMAARVGMGLEAQVGGVGVRTDDAVARFGGAVVVGGPRHQGPAASEDVPSRSRRPLVAFVDADEPVLLESAAGLGDGVIGRGTRVEELAEVDGLRP